MPDDKGKISDGYHTFDELYEHRNLLFLNLMLCYPEAAWISARNADGETWEGWFVSGIELWHGQVTYHLPIKHWNLCCEAGLKVHERSPWDGHTPQDVLDRLDGQARTRAGVLPE